MSNKSLIGTKLSPRRKKNLTSKDVHRAYILALREIEEIFSIEIPDDVFDTLKARLNRLEYGNYNQEQFDNLFDREGRSFKRAVRQWEDRVRERYQASKEKANQAKQIREQKRLERKYQQWLCNWSIFNPSLYGEL
jgi:hypothetical protein